MIRTAFVTDSGTGFSEEYWASRGIYSVPLQLECDGKTYEDYETCHPADVVRVLQEKKLLKTSLPSLGRVESLFDKLKEEGYERVFAVPICPGLSGTMNAMSLAAENAGLEFVGFDCGTTAVLQAWCIETAKRMYEQEGKSIEEILEFLEKSARGADTILLVDDLQHMKRGGRLTSTAALLGSLLKIKPVLHDNLETEGRVDVLDKVRTMSKAQNLVIERMKSLGAGPGWDVTVAHVGAPEAAQQYARKIKEAIPGITLRIINLVSAVAVHTGIGCLAAQLFDPQGTPVDYSVIE